MSLLEHHSWSFTSVEKLRVEGGKVTYIVVPFFYLDTWVEKLPISLDTQMGCEFTNSCTRGGGVIDVTLLFSLRDVG